MILGEILSPELPILYEWGDLIPDCGQYSDDVSRKIAGYIDRSEISSFSVNHETMTGFLTSRERDFLLLTLKGFKNYQQYIGVRSYGVHLDICHFLLVDPKFFTRITNPKLQGELSRADIIKILDLKSWIQVVSHCINSALAPYREFAKKPLKTVNVEGHILNL
jgi:hypothetical protein